MTTHAREKRATASEVKPKEGDTGTVENTSYLSTHVCVPYF